MKAFLLYPTYQTDELGATVQLYGKLENGETFRADIPQTPYFYIRKEDLEAAKDVAAIKTEETKKKSMQEEPLVKVLLSTPKDAPSLRKALQDAGVPCFEADIRFTYRYLIDNRITGSLDIKGDYEKGDRVDRIYNEPDITAAEWTPDNLRVASIDIETDKKAGAIWSVCIATSEGREERLIIGRDTKKGERCEDEAQLLLRLNDLVQDIDPDIITGWNFIDFDMKVLQEKYREHNITFDWARCEREVKLRIQSSYFRDSRATVTGRVVLDGIQLLRNSFINLDSYALENASQELLGDGKLFTGKQRYEEIEDAYNNGPDKLLAYNLKDCQLVLDILEETDVLNLTIKRSLLTGMQLDRVNASIASLDNVYLPALHERGYVAPTNRGADKDEGITGGFVMESKAGIYDYVIVCDFKSLYPSIMRTINVDPLSYLPEEKRKESSKEYVVAENGAVFKNQQGIMPEILENLLAEREQAKKEGDDLGQFAIKILMNSFFGVMASPNCRFFSMDIANAITHTGQYLIKKAAELIKEKGYDVIYGDTDSLFLDLKTETLEEAEATGKKVSEEINAFFIQYCKERYHRESKLELEYEKTFIRFLMPKTRKGGASKKRYAGTVRKDGKEDIEFTGLEFVRRDWTDVAKQFQKRLLELVFAKEDPKDYVKNFVDEVRAGKHDEKLIYRKALRKDIEDYTKTTPPHVKAARLMEGELPRIIEYYQTVDGPEPVGNQQHSIDYEHYIEKQVKPIADSILEFYGTSFEDVLKGTQQKGLLDF